ncbi:TlpA disulfide reductase family protein [Ammoniphilus sp. CFH 90114]|uniref:TlpA family protein disulfide reductase n=1 Tax=Ammoniphilus sp. CFH 90114 TaxID=2493665 RepID=UPI00100EB9B1|nr:TlpA disulfide reductase family protein [Ammoniphilus sp. CFH 90114]RXT14917.1 TlpA family protein disulfide reductase [Ammoniphilus sp. CFH 90114]
MKRNIVIVAIIILFASLALYGNLNHSSVGQSENKERRPEAGFSAPLFELKGLDGKTYTLDKLQKPVIINFWASWCGPCRLEAPILTSLYEQYQEDIEIWAVNVAVNDKLANAKAFAEHYDFTFPVLLDSDGSVVKSYQVMAIPNTFFLDRHQNVVKVATGLHSKEEIEEIVKQLISIP